MHRSHSAHQHTLQSGGLGCDGGRDLISRRHLNLSVSDGASAANVKHINTVLLEKRSKGPSGFIRPALLLAIFHTICTVQTNPDTLVWELGTNTVHDVLQKARAVLERSSILIRTLVSKRRVE